jgi:hypothetical protein
MITARIATLEEPRRLVFHTAQIDPDALGENELICETLVTAISPERK